MSKSNTFENDVLKCIFQNVAIAGICDALGAAGSLYVSLHTADPGEGGDQSTSECAYTGYARQAVARSAGGWTVSGNSVSPAAAISFPQGSGGGGVAATHFGVGTASSGAGKLLYSGALTPNIMTGVGVAPVLGTGTAITED